jgi:hypothetical protein
VVDIAWGFLWSGGVFWENFKAISDLFSSLSKEWGYVTLIAS